MKKEFDYKDYGETPSWYPPALVEFIKRPIVPNVSGEVSPQLKKYIADEKAKKTKSLAKKKSNK